MKRILAILAIIIILTAFLTPQVALAVGGDKQLIVSGNSGDPPSTSAVTYNSVSGGYYWLTVGTIDRQYQVVSTAGTLGNLHVKLTGSPGTGKSYTFTIMVNGTPAADIAVIISDAETYDYDASTVAVAAGDLVVLRCTPSGTPTSRNTTWSLEFIGSTSAESLVLGQAIADTSGTIYNPLAAGYPTSTTTSTKAMQIIPTNGTLKNLYIRQSADAGDNPDAYTYTLYKNGSAQTLTCSVVADATTGHDVTHSVAVVAGDYVWLQVDIVNSPTASPYVATGMTFVSTTAGQSIIFGSSEDVPTNNQTEYCSLTPQVNSVTWTTTESNRYDGSHAGFMLSNLYARINAADSGGSTTVLTVRHAEANTDITLSIAGGDTFWGSDTTHSYNTVDYEYLDMKILVSSGSSSRHVHWGIMVTQATSPTVQTDAADDITYTSATLNGQILTTGTSSPTIRGFQYGKTSGALDLDWHEHGTFGVAAFDWGTGATLDIDETYYFRAYTTNTVGTAYGAELHFDTLVYTAPTVVRLAIGTIGETTAVLNGNITSVDGINATIRGFKFDTDSGAPYGNDTHEHGNYTAGNFSASLSGLTPDTLYYYIAYATNTGGTGNSTEGNFTTLLPICGAPGNLIVTQTGVGYITITWDLGLYAEDTIIRISEDSCPGNITDGYLVYDSTGNTTSYSGLSLSMHEYCIRAWSSNDTGNSTGYAETKIGGIGMFILGEAVILLVLLAMIGVGFGFKFPPLMYIVALGGIGIGITLLGTKTALSMEWILGWVFLLVGFVSAFGGYIIQVRQNNEYNQKVDEQIAQDRKDNPLKYMSEEDRYAIEFREAGRRGAELGSQARAKRYMSNLRKGGG